MKPAMAISKLVAAWAIFCVVALPAASSSSRGGVAHAQVDPCATIAVVVDAPTTPTAAPQPIGTVESRIAMPETGSAGLLSGARRSLALQAPDCTTSTATAPSAAGSPTGTPTPASAAPTATPTLGVPDGGAIGGGGDIGPGLGGGSPIY
jgi:hypothetical protein